MTKTSKYWKRQCMKKSKALCTYVQPYARRMIELRRQAFGQVKTEKAFFALIKHLGFKVRFKKTRARLYVVMRRSIFIYDCEVCKTISQTEKRLRTFEKKVWKRLCGFIYDEARNIRC